MSFWTAVVTIVAIIAFTTLIRSHHRTKAGIITDNAGNERERTAIDEESKRELEELRERVKVLEKITVDGREARAIAEEIEALRDKQGS